MERHVLRVTGMTCDHCTRAITEELREIPGVGSIHVDLVPGGISQVEVEAESATQEQLAAAIVEAGYDIVV